MNRNVVLSIGLIVCGIVLMLVFAERTTTRGARHVQGAMTLTLLGFALLMAQVIPGGIVGLTTQIAFLGGAAFTLIAEIRNESFWRRDSDRRGS